MNDYGHFLEDDKVRDFNFIETNQARVEAAPDYLKAKAKCFSYIKVVNTLWNETKDIFCITYDRMDSNVSLSKQPTRMINKTCRVIKFPPREVFDQIKLYESKCKEERCKNKQPRSQRQGVVDL